MLIFWLQSPESHLDDEDNSGDVMIKQIQWECFKMYKALGIRCIINGTKWKICKCENKIPALIKELQKCGWESHRSAPFWRASFRYPCIYHQGQFCVPHTIFLSLPELHTFTLPRIRRAHSDLPIFKLSTKAHVSQK